MQVTTHQAGLGSSIAWLALAERIALAALAIFLMLNAVTPFITPDPPWLANLPLVVAIMAFLLAFGLAIRAERARSCRTLEIPNTGKGHPRHGHQGRMSPFSCLPGWAIAGVSSRRRNLDVAIAEIAARVRSQAGSCR